MPTEASLRLERAVPRYTSYPTAPHFHDGVTPATCRDWLKAVGDGEGISLYVHIPFCDRLCWFCACHTKQTRHYAPVAAFLQSLYAEIAAVGALAGARTSVAAVHFGGGSPTMLTPHDMKALDAALRSAFRYRADTEICVEIDPNDMDGDRLDALAQIGLTRASLGIQDFDDAVQKAINREQSFETTKAVVEGLRARGVASVNLDLLYGLPLQSVDSVARTLAKVLTLAPDRIALFGYAHVPWFKKHQTMIDAASLPDGPQRLAQFRRAGEIAAQAGYEAIGLDHFALPADTLAQAARAGTLRRNFQGYTTDGSETLVGLGPSSISRYRQGHAQNAAATGVYQRMVAEEGLATVKGIAFTEEDRLRGWVIERLMCDFAFSGEEAVRLFGHPARAVVEEAGQVARATPELLRRQGDSFSVQPAAQPLVRTIAAEFDQYLKTGTARHSVAV